MPMLFAAAGNLRCTSRKYYWVRATQKCGKLQEDLYFWVNCQYLHADILPRHFFGNDKVPVFLNFVKYRRKYGDLNIVKCFCLSLSLLTVLYHHSVKRKQFFLLTLSTF
jgi:hypothetical protein